MANTPPASRRIVTDQRARFDADTGMREAMQRLDGWINVLSGVGDGKFDMRQGAHIAPPRMWTYEQLDDLYSGNDIASTIIDVPADEMVRRWFAFEHDAADEDDDISKKVMDKLEDLQAITHFSDGPRWASLYGGAAIVMGIQDGNPPEVPVDVSSIQSVDWLSTLDRYELIPELTADQNPFAYLMNPTMYRIVPPSIENDDKDPLTAAVRKATPLIYAKPNSIDQPMGALIHSSRLLRFEGPKTPRRRRWRNFGWSDPLYTRIEEVLRDFNLSWSSAAVLLQDFAMAVWKIKGLNEILVSNNAGLMNQRMQTLNLARSVVRATMIDADGEEFERKSVEVSGLFEGLAAFATRLAAAARMPVTLLFGQAPAGLNATGDADIRNWYDRIASKQTIVLRPALNRLLRYVLLSKQGPSKGVEPENWRIRFHTLYQLTDKERADIRLSEANRANILVQAQAIMPEEVSSALASSDGDFLELKPDMELREQLADQKEEQAQIEADAAAKAAVEAQKNGMPPPVPQDADNATKAGKPAGPIEGA